MNRDATTVSISLPDAEATRALGAALAQISSPGTVLLLTGPLGAGKTTLVDGFAQAFGAGHATSPTFVIAHLYAGGQQRLWHVDLYRIEAEDEVADLDLAQYVADDAITIVEWPERAGDVWPQEAISIELRLAGEHREAHINGTKQQLSTMQAALDVAAGLQR